MPPAPPQKKQKKPKITIGNKFTFCCTPVPDASTAAPNDTSAWLHVSTVSNYPYSLRNRDQYFNIAPDTPKPRKKLIDAPETDDPGAAGDDAAYAPNANESDAGSTDSKNPNIHW